MADVRNRGSENDAAATPPTTDRIADRDCPAPSRSAAKSAIGTAKILALPYRKRVVMQAFQDYYPDEFSHCFGCGKHHPQGLRLKTFWDADDPESTLRRFTPAPLYSGGVPEHVYGGLIGVIRLSRHGFRRRLCLPRRRASTGAARSLCHGFPESRLPAPYPAKHRTHAPRPPA